VAYDVVIAGGGVIGSAIAYFLAALDDFGGSVLVVERDPTYSECSSTRSLSSIRMQFSTPENIEMSKFGIHFVKHVGEYLSVDGRAPELSLVENGYLYLATEAGLAALRANHAVQIAHGAPVALLSPAEIAARYPYIAVDDIAGGCLGLADEGWFDPYALLMAFRRKAIALGAEYVHDSVVGVTREGSRITAVTLERGGRVACGALVNAAGPRAATIAEMAGVQLPVRPRKRMIYVFDCRERLADCPLLISPNGVFVRPDSANYVCGVSPPAERDPDCLDFELDHSWFDEIVWPTLAARVPAFAAIKLVNAYACHYAYNTFDQNAILGPHPEVANLHFANGFSGHGMQQSPAVGRAIAETVAYGGFRSLDLARFGYARLASGAAIREQNVW